MSIKSETFRPNGVHILPDKMTIYCELRYIYYMRHPTNAYVYQTYNITMIQICITHMNHIILQYIILHNILCTTLNGTLYNIYVAMRHMSHTSQ